MGYYVKALSWKRRPPLWKVQYVSYKKSDFHNPDAVKPKKEWDVAKDRWRALGFDKSMTVLEAKGRAKQLNSQLFVQRQEEQIKKLETTRLKTQRQHDSVLPEEFTAEFELRFVRARDSETESGKRRRSRAFSLWQAAQRMIISLGFEPSDWFYHTLDINDYFHQRRYSVRYIQSTLKMANLWGFFICRKMGRPFLPIPIPRGYERQRLIQAYYEKERKSRQPSRPLSPEQLKSVFRKLNRANYHWLVLSVWLGLRPQEIDNLKDDNMWSIEKLGNGKRLLWVFQTKIIALPIEDRWKPIPILFDEQEFAMRILKARSFKRPIIVLSTGSGKTIIGIAAIALSKRPAICLVPTRILLEQWQERLRAQFKMPIGVLGDGKHELAPVMVATFESAYRYMNWIGNRFQLLVVDEVHHFGAGIRDEALEMCIAPYRLGLTATPVTSGEARKRLSELVGREVYEITVNELTGRYLAPFEHVTLHVDLYPDEREIYENEMGLFRAEFDRFSRTCPGSRWADFAVWAKQRPEGKRALYAFRRARQILGSSRAKEESLRELLVKHKESKVLIFTPDTSSAYAISRKFLTPAITSDIKKKEREETLERFRKGVLLRLVSCRVLNEGIDVPDAEVAVVLGGNHGEREHIQRIGRCLRPTPGKVAKVYELVAKNTIEIRTWQKRTESLAPRIFA